MNSINTSADPSKQYPPRAAPTYPGGPVVNQDGMQPPEPPPVIVFDTPMQPEILVEQPNPEDPDNVHVPQGVDDRMDFSEKTIRRSFIRKVYSILMVQLLVSVGSIFLFLYHDGVKQWSRSSLWVYLAALVGFSVMLIVLSCCSRVRRKFPGNFICLALLTLMASYMLGTITTYYSEISVLLAVGITTVVCFALTIFSFQTKIDFTRLTGFLLVGLIVLILFGFMASFLYRYIPILRIIYASLAALVFSLFLIHDTQSIIGGNHMYSISPEEYIFAAMVKFHQ